MSWNWNPAAYSRLASSRWPVGLHAGVMFRHQQLLPLYYRVLLSFDEHATIYLYVNQLTDVGVVLGNYEWSLCRRPGVALCGDRSVSSLSKHLRAVPTFFQLILWTSLRGPETVPIHTTEEQIGYAPSPPLLRFPRGPLA